ncbi:MAG: NAD-dependent epimerase/dehydratase family protein [Bacteroidota bacterium]
MKSAFVTGGTGFIGSHLVEMLLSKGYRVKCLIRKTSSLEWLKNLPVEYVYGDLFTSDALQTAVREVEYVYHLAGVVAAKNRDGYFRGNQEGTRNILEAVLTSNPGLKKFIFVSSLTAVGPSLGDDPVTEGTVPHPITAYGESKLAAEREVMDRWSTIPAVIIRAPAVYGPRDIGILTFFQTINKGLEPLIGFHEKKASLVHSTDLVNGIILAAENEKAVRTSYFIGSERGYTWSELGALTSRLLNKKTIKIKIPHWIIFAIAGISGAVGNLGKRPPIFNFEKGKDITRPNWTCSIEKAKRELGYKPTITVEQGFWETIKWYKQQGWL